jgi:hypothetical protein
MLPTCDKYQQGIVHQHILPIQQTILDCSTKYHYMQGGVGGGKSVGFAAKCVYLSLNIAKNRGVVARHNLDDLYDSSWRKVNECLENLANRDLIPNPTYSKKVSGQYTQILLHNGSEVRAVHGKNWRRGLGADHGWYWVDDALECFEEFFIGTEVSAGLISRLRLPHVHFLPELWNATNREHGALHGMVSSNPPPIGHFLHKLFGSKPGVYKIGEDTVTWTIGQTMDNPFTGADYAKGIMAVQHKMGRSQNVARRVIFGESIPAYGGVKVYPQFDEARHVGTYQYDSKLPLVSGWDFGFHHPAVMFNNLYKCEYGTNHLITLSEVADAFSLNVYELWEKHVKPHMKQRYGNATVYHSGDRAGYRKSSSSRDNRGDMRILKEEYSLPFKFRFLDLDNSLQYIRGLLDPKKPCPCGMELICIDQLSCPVLIAAMQGGYKYSKSRDGKISDRPVEDRYFADVACAHRYCAENFVKWGIPYKYQVEHEQEQHLANYRKVQQPWTWMEASDKEMATLVTR